MSNLCDVASVSSDGPNNSVTMKMPSMSSLRPKYRRLGIPGIPCNACSTRDSYCRVGTGLPRMRSILTATGSPVLALSALHTSPNAPDPMHSRSTYLSKIRVPDSYIREKMVTLLFHHSNNEFNIFISILSIFYKHAITQSWVHKPPCPRAPP